MRDSSNSEELQVRKQAHCNRDQVSDNLHPTSAGRIHTNVISVLRPRPSGLVPYSTLDPSSPLTCWVTSIWILTISCSVLVCAARSTPLVIDLVRLFQVAAGGRGILLKMPREREVLRERLRVRELEPWSEDGTCSMRSVSDVTASVS